MYTKGRAWIEINLKNLNHNINIIKNLLAPGCKLMPVVKANAYGHGAILISKTLNKLGIYDFCVAAISEGIELRKSGIDGQILVLGYTHPKQFDYLVKYNLTQTVLDLSYAEELHNYGKPLKVHIGIDTGMHRLGEPYENFNAISKIWTYENLQILGVYSHLCVADSSSKKDRAFTAMQIKHFNELINKLHDNGFHHFKSHLQSSYGLINYPYLNFDYARIGIALYGVLSKPDDILSSKINLKPVLSLKARVESIKQLKYGESAGYGLDFTADKDTKIAIISIGYADGIPRLLSNKHGLVLLHGKKASIIGKICMDQALIDITDIPKVQPNDEVVLIGKSGNQEISAADISIWSNTISNEFLSRLGTRLDRITISA